MRGRALAVRGRGRAVRGPGPGMRLDPAPAPGSLPSQPAAASRRTGSPPGVPTARPGQSFGPLENASPSRPLPAGNSPGIAAEAAGGALGRTRHRASLPWGSFTEQVRGVAEIGPRLSLWRINLALRLLLREVVVACVGDVQTDCCSYPIKISGSF